MSVEDMLWHATFTPARPEKLYLNAVKMNLTQLLCDQIYDPKLNYNAKGEQDGNNRIVL